MKIGIIGPGRVGTALGEAFKEAGYKIVGIVSRRRLLAQKCMRLTQCNNWSSNPQDIAKLADIILITVPDAEIGNIVQTLSTVVRVKGPAPTHNVGGPAPTHNVKGPAPTHNVKGPSPTYNVGGLPPQPPLERDKRDSEESGTAPTNDVVLVHTSGTLGASILGASQSLSMHPICSFAGGKLPRGTYFGIEGAVEIGERLVKSIGGIPIIISADVKPLYHAALNFGASYFLTLLDTGAKLLTSAGIKESEEVILSLAVSTLRNVKGFGISESLTGAIERGDVEVVQKEMQAMEKTSAEWLEFYKILVRETRRMKEERGKMEEGRGEMKEGRGEMKEDRVQGSKGKI